MSALAILIDPNGAESFLAYGARTDREGATRFGNASIAVKAAVAAIFGDPHAFWESERKAAAATRAAHRGWSYRIEEVPA